MADEEELKSMILSFRVSELHMLLGFAGRNKTGRKCELQARAIELLQLNSYPVILKIKNLYKSIQQGLSNGISISGSGAPQIDSTTEKIEGDKSNITMRHHPGYSNNYPSYSQQQQHQMSSRSNHMYSNYPQYQSQSTKPPQIPPSNYPVHPDVKLKKLPFYEISAELLKPSSLVPQTNQRTQDNTFQFHLTPQQANAIGLSRDMRPGSKVEYSVQGQLRFCLLETTSEQEDCFPPNVAVKVNGKPCTLPTAIPTTKPGVEPKRPPRPVNITPLMKISPTVGNSIHVQWTTDYSRGYVVAVYLVVKKTSEDLLNRLKAKGVRGADYTRGMIKDKLNEDADSEIATTSLRVSLICPLGKMRMVTPCRSSTCQHLQCFDASLYLQMNERKPTWMCPVCDKPAVYDKLVIDGYFQDVLSSSRLPPDGNEIQLHSDGSWSSLVIKKEKPNVVEQNDSSSVKVEPKIETLDLDEDDLPLKPSSTTSTVSSTNKDDSSAKRKVEEVDLTLSDSDDEPLVPKKKQCLITNHFKYTDKNGGSPNSSSGRNSPSLIILDSDSPSSTPTPTPTPTRTPTPTPVSTTPAENSAAAAPFSTAPEPYICPAPEILDIEAEPIYAMF